MPLIATRGAASAQGFGEFAQAAAPTYIEDVFSTYLYTGNDSVQTITNGIDLAGKGGLIWLKKRNNTSIHGLWDTARGGGSRLDTSSTAAPGSVSPAVTFNSNGFTLPAGGSSYLNESSTNTYVSWTFRKQPKFFDVVTYTGNGSSVTTNHSLGAAPGVIIVKATSTSGLYWIVYHRSLSGQYLEFNTTSAAITNASAFTSVTSTSFTVGNGLSSLNQNGETYVAYLFAHDAGGFGLTGSDNVISCGSVTSDASGNASINLGWEPQWVLLKNATGAQYWYVVDNMRGLFAPLQNGNALFPNSSSGETAGLGTSPYVTATGLTWNGSYNPLAASSTYIYIAIRRGPMKTPTSGTSVFAPVAYTGNNATNRTITSGFVTDMTIVKARGGTPPWPVDDRLRGQALLLTNATDAEVVDSTLPKFDLQNGWNNNGSNGSYYNSSTYNYINYNFQRAPGFFDEVCYTGTGVATNFNHNLGVAPELMIVKCRSNEANWPVYPNDPTKYIHMNETAAAVTSGVAWNNTAPTASTFRVGTYSNTNEAGFTFVAYLFASAPGVSKVGSYTGTGTTQQIDCGFTGGARFVLIKRTDSTGDWYVWDSARGIVAGNDPYLLLNSTAAEVTNTDYIDTYSAGFEISSTAPAAINANGGTFIFLAIA